MKEDLLNKLRQRAEDYRQSGPGGSAEHTAALLEAAADALYEQDRELGRVWALANRNHDLLTETLEMQNRSERQALEDAVSRMGWPEINAFKEEMRKGQDIYEDAGGYFMRGLRRLFGLGSTREEVTTYQDAAWAMIRKALDDERASSST